MVYVGAVAVLFLFVVMMLDVDFVEMKQGFLQYLPIGALVAIVLLIEMFFVGAAYFTGEKSTQLPERTSELSNLEQFGAVLYTDYAFFFEAAGLVLLVALVGAITLTLREREGVRRQNAVAQMERTRDEGVELVDIEPGQGVG